MNFLCEANRCQGFTFQKYIASSSILQFSLPPRLRPFDIEKSLIPEVGLGGSYYIDSAIAF